MGISSALKRLITGSGTGLFDVVIPGLSLKNGINLEETVVESLGEIATSVGISIKNLTQVAKTAYCLGKMITSPDMALNMLNMVAGNITAVAFNIAGNLAEAVSGQINQALAEINGIYKNTVGTIFDFLDAVITLSETLKALFDGFKFDAKLDFENFVSEEDCEFIFAQIAGCLMNQLVGDKLLDFERKVTSKITETGQSMNSAINETLADVNTINNYVERETFMMQKANKQLEGIDKLIS